MAQPLTDAINALTTYANTVTGKTPPDTTLSDAVATLASGYGGGSSDLDALCNNTLTTINSENITALNNYEFYQKTSLQSVVLPNVTSVGDRAFTGCTGLTTLHLPRYTGASKYLCSGCTSLVDYDFSNTTNIGGDHCFDNTGLTGVYAPKVTAMGDFTQNQLSNCPNLVYVRVPNANQIYVRSNTFTNDTSLKLIDFGVVTSNLANAGNIFAGCTSLEVIILRRTGNITPIGRQSDFASVTSPVTVYVPQDLKTTYEASTNWAYYVTAGKVTFAKLEGSPYEQKDFVYMGVPS